MMAHVQEYNTHSKPIKDLDVIFYLVYFQVSTFIYTLSYSLNTITNYLSQPLNCHQQLIQPHITTHKPSLFFNYILSYTLFFFFVSSHKTHKLLFLSMPDAACSVSPLKTTFNFLNNSGNSFFCLLNLLHASATLQLLLIPKHVA